MNKSAVAQFPRLSIIDIAKLIPSLMSKQVSIADILWIAGCIATTFENPVSKAEGLRALNVGQTELANIWASLNHPKSNLTEFTTCVENLSLALNQFARENEQRLNFNEKLVSAGQMNIVNSSVTKLAEWGDGIPLALYVPPLPPSPIPVPPSPDETPVGFSPFLLIPIIQAILKLISLFR